MLFRSLEEIGHGSGPGVRGSDGLCAVALGPAEFGNKLAGSLRTLDRCLGGGSEQLVLVAARIGGDEFVVLMADICEDQKDVIQKKVEQMNEFLRHPSDGLPPMSLSVGVAFSNNGYNEELYKKADKALYFVKEHGRDGCCFFDEKMMDVRDSAI